MYRLRVANDFDQTRCRLNVDVPELFFIVERFLIIIG